MLEMEDRRRHHCSSVVLLGLVWLLAATTIAFQLPGRAERRHQRLPPPPPWTRSRRGAGASAVAPLWAASRAAGDGGHQPEPPRRSKHRVYGSGGNDNASQHYEQRQRQRRILLRLFAAVGLAAGGGGVGSRSRLAAIFGASTAAMYSSSSSIEEEEVLEDRWLQRPGDLFASSEAAELLRDTHLDRGDAQGLIRAVTAAPETTWEGLLGMAASLGPLYFDAENCGAVLNRLGKLAEAPSNTSDDGLGPSPTPRRAIVRDARFHRLLAHMAGTAQSVEWSPKACTLILNGLSHLVKTPQDAEPGTPHHASLRRVVGYATDCLVLQEPEALAPRHVSLSLNALVRLLPLLRGGEDEAEAGQTDWGLFVSVMVSRAHPLLPFFPPRELATFVNALSRLLSPANLPLLGGSLPAEVGLGPWHLTPAFMGELEGRAEALLGQCQPQDIANLAHGLARIRGLCDADQQEDEAEEAAAAASPSFLRGLQEAALLLGAHEFKPSELAMAAYGLARLAASSHSTSSDEASTVIDTAFLRAWGQALWDKLTTGDDKMHPRELVVLLDSLVRLGYRPTPTDLHHHLLPHLTTPSSPLALRRFSPHELATLASAVARAFPPTTNGGVEAAGPVLDAVVAEAGATVGRIKEFTPTELAALVHALGRANHPPPEAFLLAAVQHLKSQLTTEEGDATTTPAKALANLMAGFGRLGFYPGDALAACVRRRLLALLQSLNERDVRDVVGAWADLAHRPDVELLGALLPSIAARLRLDTNTAPRLAARLLPALWRLAPALEQQQQQQQQLAALIVQAEGILTTAPSTPTARVRVLAALAWEQQQQQQEGQDEEATTTAAASAAFLRGLAERTLQALVLDESESEGMAALDGEALATLLGALARSGYMPAMSTDVKAALEVRAVALLPTMPLATLARIAVAFVRCSNAHVYVPSTPFLDALARALQRQLEGLVGLEGVVCWSQIGEALHALSTLRGDGDDPDLTAAYLQALTHHLPALSPTDLAAALHTLARAHAAPIPTSFHAALDAALRHILAGQQQPLAPSTLVPLLSGLAGVGHRPQDAWLLRRLAEAAAARVGDMGTRGIVQVLEALARLGFHPGVDVLSVLLAGSQQRMQLGLTGTGVLEAEDGSEDVGAFGPPDTKGLATLVRALLRLSHHPGRDFLRTLEGALARTVARGARLAWAPMALAAFGHRVSSGSNGGSSSPAFHRALSRGLMLRGATNGGNGGVQQPPRRIATLTLSQLAALLWGLAAIDDGDVQSVTGRRLARRVMAEACLRLQGQGPKTGDDAEEDEDEGVAASAGGVLECDVDALTVHARLQQAGAYFVACERAGPAATEAEQRQRQLPARFLRLVDGYRRQCLGGGEDEEEEEVASSSPEAEALAAAVCARLGARGWACRVPQREGQQQADGSKGWLETPDVVVLDDDCGRPLALALLLPGQYFATTGLGLEEDDDFEPSAAWGLGWGLEEEEDEGAVRPMGAAAFRLRMLAARWGVGRLVAVTPEGLAGLEGRVAAAFERE